jgi:hypothetical protein
LPKCLFFCLKEEKKYVPNEVREEFWFHEEKAGWLFSGVM